MSKYQHVQPAPHYATGEYIPTSMEYDTGYRDGRKAEKERGKAEIAELRRQLAAAQKDAERYRFIRDIPYTDEIRVIMSLQQNALMDEAIDAANESSWAISELEIEPPCP